MAVWVPCEVLSLWKNSRPRGMVWSALSSTMNPPFAAFLSIQATRSRRVDIGTRRPFFFRVPSALSTRTFLVGLVSKLKRYRVWLKYVSGMALDRKKSVGHQVGLVGGECDKMSSRKAASLRSTRMRKLRG